MAINSVPAPAKDDMTTVCAIRLLAAILANVLHEGLGHAVTALLTGTKLGVLTTVAWSSDFDSRRVAAGRTLANLAAGMVYWIALRNSQKETQTSGCASFGRGNDALDRFTLALVKPECSDNFDVQLYSGSSASLPIRAGELAGRS